MGKSPLYNLKVLDFTTLLPGPFATMYLADMGAEVVKISSKKRTDLVLEYGAKDEETNLSATGMWLNRNKKTIAVDLKAEDSVDLIKKLIMKYDILIEQFRPGVMEKLGLSYDELSKINPRLIYCSISSYGNSGVDSKKAGHDLNFLARSGILSLSGKKDQAPSLINAQIGDIAGGALHSLVGILSAVNYRNLTGKGQYIDISMMDCIIPMNTFEGADYLYTGKLPEKANNDFNGGGIYDIYTTKDNKYISIASLEPKFFKAFCSAIGREDLIKNGPTPKDNGKTKKIVEDIIKQKTLDDWLEILAPLDACIEPISSLEDVFEKDEHIKDRNMVVNVPSNNKKVRQMAMPIKFSESEINYRFAGKKIGVDNEEVLKSLGLSDEEISNLKCLE